MKLTKTETNFGIDVSLEDNDSKFEIIYAGNLDLYWSIKSNIDSDKHSFIITKENEGIYKVFEELYSDIENINLFSEIDPYFEDRTFEEIEKEREEQRKKYKLYNCSNYNELFDEENRTITWYSDETNHEVSNILRIKKLEDRFEIEFSTQPYTSGYDRDFNSPNHIPIRFRNSGSYYKPFNLLFMIMYKKLMKIEDVNDYGHQMTIEEFLYSKKKVNKLTNKQ